MESAVPKGMAAISDPVSGPNNRLRNLELLHFQPQDHRWFTAIAPDNNKGVQGCNKLDVTVYYLVALQIFKNYQAQVWAPQIMMFGSGRQDDVANA